MIGPLVAFVHATPASIEPADAALRAEFPEADSWHLLDDRLIREADEAGGLTRALRLRMLSLIRHAVDGGAEAVQLSCSMYGPVAALARQLWPVPVRGSDDAAFAEVARRGCGRVVLLAPLESALADSARRLAEVATGTEIVAERARPGSVDSLARAAKPHLQAADLVLLGQYSLSPHARELAATLNAEVLSTPSPGLRELRAHLLGDSAGAGS
ncbi:MULTISPECIES: aspartate/glutamate racemase family protein [unclassified Saccharopolyspora]|uniref:aspartate/glutamate racemase family protein n=1 Tax=Saccharopolyspora TaxID=1835 RepID=UPI00190C1B72|nr:aspartate/glutamate racemase family protein [Saccharopolyspora sp. HNM0986]MBK0869674.1 hypothetical protein [Saccharopolyspora sp. HNM0986]